MGEHHADVGQNLHRQVLAVVRLRARSREALAAARARSGQSSPAASAIASMRPSRRRRGRRCRRAPSGAAARNAARLSATQRAHRRGTRASPSRSPRVKRSTVSAPVFRRISITIEQNAVQRVGHLVEASPRTPCRTPRPARSPDAASDASTPASLVAAGTHIGPVAETMQSSPVGHSGLQADRHVPETQVNPDLHVG